MDFVTAIKTVLTERYADFNGRSRRSEYWWFALANAILSIILYAIDVQALTGLVQLALLLPSIAVGVRRLHDIGKSGWLYLLVLVPLVNLYLIYLFTQDSQPGENEYGPNPKYA